MSVEYTVLPYPSVSDSYKDHCFRMYWLAKGMLALDPGEADVRIRFITRQRRPSFNDPLLIDEEIAGLATLEGKTIYVNVDYPLHVALKTTAHELMHQAQFKREGWKGWPALLTGRMEEEATTFEVKAFWTYIHRFGLLPYVNGLKREQA